MRVDDELARHAFDRRSSRAAIDVGHGDDVGRGQRFAELPGEMASPRVEVRLEEREHATVDLLTHRGERRGDLRRMVRVVVDDPDAAGDAALLEPPPRAAETPEDRPRLVIRNPGELERCQRRGRIPAVVLARQPQLALERLQPVAPDDLRDGGEPALEQLLDLGLRAELAVVVEVDVRHDGDLRTQVLDRPVGLVALDDEPTRPARAFPPSCGISAPIRKDGSRPRRSRTNAIIAAVVVFPCAPETTIASWSETSSARNSARLRPERGRRRPSRRRLGAGGRRRNLLGDRDGDPGLPDVLQVRRLVPVPAGDLRAPGVREQRVAAEAGAADPDEEEALPSSGRKGDQLLRDLVGRVGPSDPAHRRGHLRQPLGVAEQRARSAGDDAELGLRESTTAPPACAK